MRSIAFRTRLIIVGALTAFWWFVP